MSEKIILNKKIHIYAMNARSCHLKRLKLSEPRKHKHATKARTGERAECLIACVPRHREGGPCDSSLPPSSPPLTLSLSLTPLFRA